VAWLKRIVTAAGSQRKLILFSHHQPFSQLDAQGPNLQVALADLDGGFESTVRLSSNS
jgi:hypothetical protein